MDQPISPSVCTLIKGQLSTRYLSGLRQRWAYENGREVQAGLTRYFDFYNQERKRKNQELLLPAASDCARSGANTKTSKRNT